MSKLKTLDEHNAWIIAERERIKKYPSKNGIACPKCGNEMDDCDDYILTSYPPKKTIKCSVCFYYTTRLC